MYTEQCPGAQMIVAELNDVDQNIFVFAKHLPASFAVQNWRVFFKPEFQATL
jgi:hypothetical protein